ncbi:MAG TPA: SusC/RagA family TonB-linked outer membrane protein [Gemmatimonadaceae bacterium]|nr:SusC/RagA family TonB-linked outer membrane protein [Gemmatimonadaceae bacterium]
MRKLCSLVVGTLLSAICSHAALAQRSIHGTVTDVESGAPVNAVRVTVKGTSIGTYTGADGRFNINVPNGAVTLDVRRIGYQPATVPVAADQNEVAVKIKADVMQLSQEVITGQATSVARRNLANDVAVVKAEDLTHTHTPTLENALQGKVAGAVVTANSGAPGGGLQVRMRGVTSIFGNSQPLYVIDGLPVANTTINNGLNAVSSAGAGMNASSQDNGVNRIADLNPDDIENIEILKGPSAAAIYGSQAANGVVVITTKHGTSGKPRFALTQRFGTHELEHKLGARHFTQAEAEDFASAYGIDAATVDAWYQQTGGFEDYEQEVYGDKSLSYESNLSLSGGTDATQYFVSGLAMHDNGIMRGTGYDKQSVRANLTQLVGSKLQVKVNTNLVHSLTKRGISNNDNVNVTPYFVFAQTPSFFPLRNPDGSYNSNPFISSHSNPLQTAALLQVPEDNFRFIGSVNAKYSVFTSSTQSLDATMDLGIDHYTYKSNIYSPAALFYEPVDGLPGTATDLTGTETRAPIALTLKHAYTPSPDGFQATTSAGLRRGYDNLAITNVVTQDLLTGQHNIDRGSATNVFENRQPVRTLAVFGQEEVLMFNQRLYLSGGILGQRSTNNADVNKLFYYPKVSGSYRFPELGPFTEFKLRAAYGETGNEPVYGNKFTSLNGVTYDGQNGLQIGGTLADPNLHPEREKEIEVGLDFGMLDSRIAFSGSVYQKTNSDLLLQQRLAPTTGYAVRIFNGGEIRNRGVELSLTGFPVQSKELTWESHATFTKNVGKVTQLPVPAFRPPNSFGFAYGSGFIEQGHSPSQIYGINADGDPVQMGDYEPKFTVGFSNQFTVGPFRLYGLIDWRHGGDVVDITQNVYDELGTAPDVAASTDRVTRFHNGESVYIQDASFVKLRELTLSYQLPETLVHSVFGGVASGVRAELSGRNLKTWTSYPGLDPEVSNFGNQNINRSQDLAPFPPSRSFFFTLAVDF